MEIILSSSNAKRLTDAGVIALYLFGSRATGHDTAASDFDFAVVLKDPEILRNIQKQQARYLALYDILTDIIGPQPTDPIVDIVFLQSDASLELKGNIIRNGKLLLDTDPNTRANLEAYLMMRVADFKPILDEMDKAILDRI